MKIQDTTIESLTGGDDEIFLNSPKLFEIKVPIPAGYLGNLTVELVNDQYDDDVIVDFCGAAIVLIGDNLPCLHITDDISIENGEESKVVDG